MTNHFQTVEPALSARNSVYISLRRAPGGQSLCRIIAFEDSLDPALQDLYGDLDRDRVNTILLKLGMTVPEAQAVLAAAVGSAQIQRFRLELSGEQCTFLRSALASPDISSSVNA